MAVSMVVSPAFDLTTRATLVARSAEAPAKVLLILPALDGLIPAYGREPVTRASRLCPPCATPSRQARGADSTSPWSTPTVVKVVFVGPVAGHGGAMALLWAGRAVVALGPGRIPRPGGGSQGGFVRRGVCGRASL